jgi:hypothetical protein
MNIALLATALIASVQSAGIASLRRGAAEIRRHSLWCWSEKR